MAGNSACVVCGRDVNRPSGNHWPKTVTCSGRCSEEWLANGDAALKHRFWSKVEKGAGCWLWTAHVAPNGYGMMTLGGHAGYAHRLAYRLMKGQIPARLQLDHLCRTRHCVNPDHLEPVTQKTN